MGRIVLIVVVSVGVGAAGMKLFTRLTTRAPADDVLPPAAEPALLPAVFREPAELPPLPAAEEIQPASATLPLLTAALPLTAAAPDPAPPKIAEIQEPLRATGGPAVAAWPAAGGVVRLDAAAGDDLTVVAKPYAGDADTAKKLAVYTLAAGAVAATDAKPAFDPATKAVTFKLKRPADGKRFQVALLAPPAMGLPAAADVAAAGVTVVPPEAATPDAITVAGFGLSRYVDVAKPADTNPVTIVNGYVRVRGGTAVGPRLAFLLVDDAGAVTPVPDDKAKLVPRPLGEWEYEFYLDRLATRSRRTLLIRAAADDRHYAAKAPVVLEWDNRATPAAPAFADALDVPPAGSGNKAPVGPLAGGANYLVANAAGAKVYRANTKGQFTVAVTKPGDAQALLLYVGGQETPVRALSLAAVADATATFTAVTLPGDGDQVVAVAAANGGDPPGPKAFVTVRVQTAGPQAVQASSPAFGTSPQRRETIRVQFSGSDIDPDSVRNPASYSLAKADGSSPQTPTDLKYDEGIKAVTFTVVDVVPGTYTLTVKSRPKDNSAAGVRDLFGNYLVNQTGARDADQTFTLTATGDPALPSVPATTLSLTTGPNVEYKEFEPRKTFLNGFNPADRVETRVVRLYYNRDAARVVQVVNRDAKAYNAPSVDVRRRAADRTRDDANALTDERKRQADVAIQAAADARAVETRLKELQGQLAASRTQSALASSQLSQRQEQLLVAQRALTRDTTDLGVRRATDSSTDQLRSRRDQLALQVKQLKQLLADAGATEATLPATLDRDVLAAQQVVQGKRQALATQYTAARAAVKDQPTVAAAQAKVTNLEAALTNPALTPAALQSLNEQLVEAKAQQSEAVQAAILGNPDLSAKLQTATTDLQTEQFKLDQKAAARRALDDLPGKQQNLADAELDLQRATASAGGVAANDPGTDRSQDSVTAIQTEIRRLQTAASAAAANEQSLQASIGQAITDLQAKRIKEVEATQAVRALEQRELRAREGQFRAEVAAAKEDPDIYAYGKPQSDDPVRQCSLSVIGEGLIQIRGPIKGVNVIRTMIDQMDAPTGQVRIGVHTIQVNGERVDRMNRVVLNIQRYLDHARFLTVQSTQMLRKAVTTVAARKAEEAAATLPPNCPPAERDGKYLTSFFGREFIDELRALDSEFLRTGNKLLSLHSMDSTSLSAALSLLALAKNDVRLEILQEFDAQLKAKLPEAELSFYEAGQACPTKCEACYDKKFCVLAYNAKFESLRGYFNLEILGADTLTPPQREFIKLAQIFKTRLVTELELKQRVVERSLLEERLGDYQKELQEAKDREDEARRELATFTDGLNKATAEGLAAVYTFQTQLNEVEASTEGVVSEMERIKPILTPKSPTTQSTLTYQKRSATVTNTAGKMADEPKIEVENPDVIASAMIALKSQCARFKFLNKDLNQDYQDLAAAVDRLQKVLVGPKVTLTPGQVTDVTAVVAKGRRLLGVITEYARLVRLTIEQMFANLKKGPAGALQAAADYFGLRDEILPRLDGATEEAARRAFDQATPSFTRLRAVSIQYDSASRKAQQSRRRLDEKKLLDMLIDDMEDKYIELLDGTRAHTANYDNYLKGLSTALEDDFNTQFYLPAFQKVRTLGAGWDVSLGQIETTTVLTNNRAFAKVSPAASMEFDLPKRDIFIKEAFKGAKAAVDEYGALLNDPTFLALTKLYSGTPTAAQVGTGGGLSPVRNVLPGLPSSADELLMAQAGPNRREFGAALEALIPDPSVYKFETGTGFEIRPVMSPDGQAVVFNFDYLYTTDVREPVRADEKHLGRVKRHFVHTDVQLSNFEMREVSKYWVSLKAARTSRGVQLLQDVPGVGVLFRPLPSASSSLQQNLIYSQAALFPTLFDLMGLRYAPTIADIDPEFTKNDEFVVRGRRDYLRQFIFDYGASRVDDALRILYGERRPDLYRSQHTIPWEHPNGYRGPGMRLRDAELQEGYDPRQAFPPSQYRPGMHTPLPSAPLAPGFDLPPGATFAPPPPGDANRLPPPRDFTAQPLGTTVTREGGAPRNLMPIPTTPDLTGRAPSIPPPPMPVDGVPQPPR